MDLKVSHIAECKQSATTIYSTRNGATLPADGETEVGQVCRSDRFETAEYMPRRASKRFSRIPASSGSRSTTLKWASQRFLEIGSDCIFRKSVCSLSMVARSFQGMETILRFKLMTPVAVLDVTPDSSTGPS